jgi:ribosomal-protein-alanine N-acetyltransferase
MEEVYSLRPAAVDDLDRILEIEQVAQPVGAWSRMSFEAEFEKPYSRFLVLTDDETDSKLAGYLVYWVLFEEASLQTIAVDVAFRGLGMAKQMMRSMITEAVRQGAKKVNLEVRKGNAPALHLYQGLGFTVSQVRKQFYSDGDDAYQMTLQLDGQPIVF